MSTTTETQRGRLRFDGVECTPTPDGYGTISVRLEWDGVCHEGEARGVQTREGDIRTAALATLEATRAVLGEKGPKFDLIGVKGTRAFDAWVVIASVDAREGDEVQRRLLGAKTCDDDDLVRASVIATLDALNRLLEKYLK
jgi:hypothetical protein